MHNDKMTAALALAARGFRVFPLPPNGRRPSAEWKGWPQHATTDSDRIRAWWDGTDCNIAICTSGLLVVDIDVKKGRAGRASWDALGGGPDTLTVRTPSGGLHLYYSGADVALSAGALGDGLDIRSHNGYVVAPGSVVDGVAYEVIRNVPMQPAPEHIVARCRPPGQRAENASVPLVDLDTPAAVQAAVERVTRAPPAMQGEQSEAAYKLACAVRDHGISEALCNTLMRGWGARCAPPILPDDLRGRVANAYAYAQNAAGAKHPEMLFGEVRIEPVPPPPEPSPQDSAAQAERSGLRLLTVEECAATPPRGYVIKGVLAPGQHCCIFGQPGAGKSVLAPHLAYAVAQGRRAFGLRTRQGAVFYIAAEDEAGMRQRVTALRERHGAAPLFHLMAGVASLVDADSGDLARLLQLVEEFRPSLVIVDTLAASAPGLDENSSEGMSRIVHAMRTIRQRGPAVILVHHSPKSGDTPRGHGVLNGDLDVSIIVGSDAEAEDLIRGELKKNRNGTCALDITFRIESATMGQDDDGDAITAPVCLERTEEEARTDRKVKLRSMEAKALVTLGAMTDDLLPVSTAPAARFTGPRSSVALEDWKARCTSKGVLSDAVKPGARTREFNTARNGLVAKNCIYIADGRVTYLGHGNEDVGQRPKAPAWTVGIVLPPPASDDTVSGASTHTGPPSSSRANAAVEPATV